MIRRKEGFMTNRVPFDTLAYAKKLEAGGVEVKQAETHAEVLAEVLETHFLTKKDSDARPSTGLLNTWNRPTCSDMPHLTCTGTAFAPLSHAAPRKPTT